LIWDSTTVGLFGSACLLVGWVIGVRTARKKHAELVAQLLAWKERRP
jgi:hypothetical protein